MNSYIILTTEKGKKKPVNVSAILTYREYNNYLLPNTKTRLLYLNNDFLDVRETVNQIDMLILNVVRKSWICRLFNL